MWRITHILALIAVCALVFQGSLHASAGTGGGYTVTICSPDGTRDIVVGQDGTPQTALDHCPKCFVSFAAILGKPNDFPSQATPDLPEPRAHYKVERGADPHGFSARAPPYFQA